MTAKLIVVAVIACLSSAIGIGIALSTVAAHCG